MKRVAAIAAAVAMVAGAWVVRDSLDERGGDGPGGGSAPEELRMTCATELDAVCRRLADSTPGLTVRIEDPGITADRLAALGAGTDPGFDVWLADGPWAQMVADDRSFGDMPGAVLGDPSPVIARSPAVIALRADLQRALETSCGGSVSWRCIGEQAGSPDQPGSPRVGLSTPDRGDGLVPLANATAGFFGDTSYSVLDFEEPGFAQWFDQLTGLSRRTDPGRRSALATAVGQAGSFNVVGALEAETVSLLRDRDDWIAIYPEPMSTAEVRLVPRAGIDRDAALERLLSPTAQALTASGWRSGSTEGAGRVPADAPAGAPANLPTDPGLPSAGVLNALRDLW